MSLPVSDDVSMASENLISVVIPAHNVERFIGEALDSALRQTHSELEVIVVDDGSVDRTPQIVAEAARRDSRVRLITTTRVGVSAARNLGIAKSRGRFIASLDADDIWREDKLELQIGALRRLGNEVGLVYCWSSGINDAGRIILPAWNNSTAQGSVLIDIVVSGIVGNGSTPLIRREYVDAVGGYDVELSLCEDWKFYTALAAVCEFAVIPECLTGYRLRDDSASINVLPMEKAIERVTQWIIKSWPSLSRDVLLDRGYTVNMYLAFIAIRQRAYFHSLRFLLLAARARPRRAMTARYFELYALLIAHFLGFRQYRWLFWRPPKIFAVSKGAPGLT